MAARVENESADGELDSILSGYDFELPEAQIAQTPLADREASRLLVVSRDRGEIVEPALEQRVRDLPLWLEPGDLLVVNATRVVPARLLGRKASGGIAEALLLGREESRDAAPGSFRALLKCTGRVREGLVLAFRRPGTTGLEKPTTAMSPCLFTMRTRLPLSDSPFGTLTVSVVSEKSALTVLPSTVSLIGTELKSNFPDVKSAVSLPAPCSAALKFLPFAEVLLQTRFVVNSLPLAASIKLLSKLNGPSALSISCHCPLGNFLQTLMAILPLNSRFCVAACNRKPPTATKATRVVKAVIPRMRDRLRCVFIVVPPI